MGKLLEGRRLSWFDRFWKRREVFVEINIDEGLVRGRRLKLPERRVASFLTAIVALPANRTPSRIILGIISLERCLFRWTFYTN